MTCALTVGDFNAGGGLQRADRSFEVVVSATTVDTAGKLSLDSEIVNSPIGALMSNIKTQLDAIAGWNGRMVAADLQTIQSYQQSAELLIGRARSLVNKATKLGEFLKLSEERFGNHQHVADDFVDGVFSPDRLGKDASEERFLAGNQRFVRDG